MKQIRWQRVAVVYLIGTIVSATLHLAARHYSSEADARASEISGPQVVIRTTRHDFGRVKAGTDLRLEFTVGNRGVTRIVLNHNGCAGCSDETPVRQAIILPGESLAIPVSLNTAGKRGPLQRVVEFTTSDPKRPRIEFTVTAEIVADQ